DLPAIVTTSADPRPRVLCGQGPAPAGATIGHFRDHGFEEIPGSGPLAAAVPGAVDAWLLLLRDHGTLGLRDVLQPAIDYARHGHPLVPAVHSTIDRVRGLFEQHWPTSAALWTGSAGPRPGQLFVNRAWAETLDRLVRIGESAPGDREAQVEAVRHAWGQGFVAAAVDRFSREALHHPGGQVLPGLVTGADLAAYCASWEDPVVSELAGHRIAKTDVWGQGPTLLQTFGILQALARTDGSGVLDPDTEQGAHALVESWKLAMADREAWYGDSGDLPTAQLLSDDYAAQRAGLVGDSASLELRPGSPGGHSPRLPSALDPATTVTRPDDPSAGEPTVRAARADGQPLDDHGRGDTCHVDVVDRWGNMISATPSGGWLQSSPTIPDLGFCLGSRLQMFWLEEGLPSSLVPGARPRTTLTPTLVLAGDEPVLACGSPGGDQQDQWQSLFLLRHLVGGHDLQTAIDAPMLHTASFPSSFAPRVTEPGAVYVEDRVDPAVLTGLERRGHLLQRTGPWSLGRMCAVARDPDTGVLTAGANPRGMQGYAAGR
ncbi:gamma-glutamyltransferase family protein, partial [Nocardioides sp.]|uniref:gamma-glutamyltransferase family protein n=1 Tax=Nocardioides sp. TaxID=35761 RepID=UPI002734CB01